MSANSLVLKYIYLDKTVAVYIATVRNSFGKSTSISTSVVRVVLAIPVYIVPAQLTFICILHGITSKQNKQGDVMLRGSGFYKK